VLVGWGRRQPADEVDRDLELTVARCDAARLERDAAVGSLHRVQLDQEAVAEITEGRPSDPWELAELELEVVEVHSAIFSLAA
jgi:chaperone required for assembly of F1-ATPase